MVSNMVQDCLRELPMGDVLLKGHVGDLAERFFHHRVNSRFARETVYKETISCRVCDFASAGNVEDNQASLFSIFF